MMPLRPLCANANSSNRFSPHEWRKCAGARLHEAAVPLAPHAANPTPGSADLCLIITTPMPETVAHLQKHGVTLEAGPVPRTGALGEMISVYFRDPDDNLIEISNYTG